MIVGHQVGQVGVGRVQLEGDHVALGLHVGDALHDAKGARLGLLVGVTLQRGDHVLGGHGLAVVEFHPGADLELPFGRVGRRRDFLGDAVVDGAVRIDVNQQFAPGHVHLERHFRGRQRRVKAVGRFTALHADLDHAALLGLLRQRRLREQGRSETGRNAQRGGPRDEFTAGHPAATRIGNHAVKLLLGITHLSFSLLCPQGFPPGILLLT